MRFNFPNKKECVQISLKFKRPLFKEIATIAENEECLRSEAIMALLEGAVEEYHKQKNAPKKTAYPVEPPPEQSPEEVKVTNPPPLKNLPVITKEELERDVLFCEKCNAEFPFESDELEEYEDGLYCKSCISKMKLKNEQVAIIADHQLKTQGYIVEGWSALHDKCQDCGTTERKHVGHGLCGKCYNAYEKSSKNENLEANYYSSSIRGELSN